MLINVAPRTDKERHVKFIDYTGRWPSLCHGTLTLEIDSKKYTFGQTQPIFSTDKGPFADFKTFWETGGNCPLYGEVEQGEWLIDYEDIPDEFKKYAAEIDKVFNDHVSWGCCGGCR